MVSLGFSTTVCAELESCTSNVMQKLKVPFMLLSYLVSVIDRTQTRHREANPKKSERGHRVRAGCCSLLPTFVASSRTLHLIRYASHRVSKTTATVVIIRVINSASIIRDVTTRQRRIEASCLSRRPRRQVPKN